jgi:hypothetical protein
VAYGSIPAAHALLLDSGMPQFNAEFVVVIVGIRRSCRRYPATHKMPEVCQDSADFWGMQSELENPGCSLSEDIHRRTKCASTKRANRSFS